jgi:hypothetical protein
MLSVPSQDRAKTFVNCWHMNDIESHAMWARYGLESDSICIQTSFTQLRQLLPNQCYLGGVNYIDFDRQVIDVTNSLNAIVHKERKYADEQEIRAVVWGKTAADNFKAVGESGIAVPMDFVALMERLYLHPSVTPMQNRSAADLLCRYGLKEPTSGISGS